MINESVGLLYIHLHGIEPGGVEPCVGIVVHCKVKGVIPGREAHVQHLERRRQFEQGDLSRHMDPGLPARGIHIRMPPKGRIGPTHQSAFCPA